MRRVLICASLVLLFAPWAAAQDVQEVAPNIEALKQERVAVAKTVEVAALKVQLLQTQASLIQALFAQAEAETAVAQQAQQDFEARVRVALGAKEGDTVDYETMTLTRAKPPGE